MRTAILLLVLSSAAWAWPHKTAPQSQPTQTTDGAKSADAKSSDVKPARSAITDPAEKEELSEAQILLLNAQVTALQGEIENEHRALPATVNLEISARLYFQKLDESRNKHHAEGCMTNPDKSWNCPVSEANSAPAKGADAKSADAKKPETAATPPPKIPLCGDKPCGQDK